MAGLLMDLRIRAEIAVGGSLHHARQRVALALLRANGWEPLRCASCPGTACILCIDTPGVPTRCSFRAENDRTVAFVEGY